jgi:GcrA cell cycle regulator
MDWNEDQIAELRRLWAAGPSTAEIGRILGCGKNAVVGKAHRLGLPSRPSPIRTSLRSAQASARRAEHLRQVQALNAQGFTAAAMGARLGIRAETVGKLLRSVGLASPGRGALPAGAGLPDVPVVRRAAAPRDALPSAPVAAHPSIRADRCGCRWPLGEPRTAGFRFCNEPGVVPGKPYCAEHCAIAYVVPLRAGEAMAPRGWVQ